MIISLFLVGLVALARAGDVIVEPNITYQTLLGYGQGSMDQANPRWYVELSPEGREELLDRLYTLKGDGLGLTICRTYICAGDAPGHAHWYRNAGGSRAPLGYQPEEGKFTWDGHENTLWHAQGAAARGALMVAFFNSPPWWMTVSGCTSGAAGGTNNLRAGFEDKFAVYMCEVMKHYRDAWGVDFDRVSPINEPEANWWKEGEGQDGCGVDARQAAIIFAALAKRIRAYGLKAKVQGFEAAFAGSLGYLDEVLADGPAYEALADLTCHQYQADFHGLRRWPTRARLHRKGLWMSEWGDWTNKGLPLALNYARKLHEAHRVMQAEAWCMWEPAFLFDQVGDRLQPNLAYYAVAQFSRFARPGMVAIEATDTTLKTMGYLDPENRTLVLVTVNDTEATQPVRYDLSAFSGLGQAQGWRTSAEERLVELPQIHVENEALSVILPAESITTFRLPYQDIRPPLVRDGGFESGRLEGWHREPEAITGVQDNYPQGGSCDGFIDLTPGATGRLWQEVHGLIPGGRYVLTATCATSGIEAMLWVQGEGRDERVTASGGSYQLRRVEFTAPPDGLVAIGYSAGPVEAQRQWATIDNVRLSPLP